ncbi:hypothetical protein Gotri_021362 [Gossypium trilobum]|uniref:Uncharacterized protein n=1 Tax=Gossypium trilobum TaxID=34281 RepID=A0A7J9DC94_9ROSI|nr:hypothetical protein [Gossypium trilobum]
MTPQYVVIIVMLNHKFFISTKLHFCLYKEEKSSEFLRFKTLKPLDTDKRAALQMYKFLAEHHIDDDILRCQRLVYYENE